MVLLAADIQRTRTTLVEHSGLHFKDSLVTSLGQFIENAKSAGRNLHKFSSRVGGTVDEIVSLNEHALQLLERTANEVRPQIAEGPIQRVFNSLFPTKPVQPEVVAARREEIKTVWYQMTNLMKTNIKSLIFEAKLNVGALDRLEQKLRSINEILARVGNHISAEEAELVCCFLNSGTTESCLSVSFKLDASVVDEARRKQRLVTRGQVKTATERAISQKSCAVWSLMDVSW